MASFLDKIKIKTPVSPKHKQDLSCQHITTFDFMGLQPIYYRNLIPNEDLSLRGVAMVRMDDLPVPTYGRADLNIRAFFVPFRSIFAGWHDFIADVIHTPAGGSSNGVPQPIVPSVFNSTLVSFLTTSPYSRQIATGETPDFVTDESNASSYIFTPLGRQVFKILTSLGYRIRWTVNMDADDERYSALPILAFLRVYLDYYYPSQYYDRPDRVQLEEYLKYDAPTGPIVLNSTHLDFIFTHVSQVCYESDYFTSAFDNPAGPNVSNTTTPFTFEDVTLPDESSSSVVTADQSRDGLNVNTPVIRTSSGINPKSISQYAIDMLKKLSDYMKRNQLVGNRAVDRLLARFGVKVSDVNRSILLGSHKVPLFVQDVMNTADTAQYNDDGVLVSGARTGEYAGKGIMAGEFNFDVDSGAEFGLFIVMSSLVPKVGYYQGIDRHNLHLTRTDFLLPDFDAVGTQPIFPAELFVPTNGNYAVNAELYSTPFGFAPAKAEYKVAHDFVSGDFQCKSKSRAGMSSDSWHLLRDMDQPQYYESIANLIHQASFVYGDDADQYNRIFANTTDSADHFTAHYSFNVVDYQPSKPLYDQYEFDGDGDEVLIDVNGTKVN